MERGEPLPVMVRLDMFRGAVKLLSLLTEPGELTQAGRNAKYIAVSGVMVPIISGLTGEFADDDLRVQQLCMRLMLHLCTEPSIRQRLLVASEDLLEMYVLA